MALKQQVLHMLARCASMPACGMLELDTLDRASVTYSCPHWSFTFKPVCLSHSSQMEAPVLDSEPSSILSFDCNRKMPQDTAMTAMTDARQRGEEIVGLTRVMPRAATEAIV